MSVEPCQRPLLVCRLKRRTVGGNAPLQELGKAAADHAAHGAFRMGRKIEIGQRPVERKREVADRIDERSVEIEDNRAERLRLLHHAAAARARMAAARIAAIFSA